MVRIGFGHGGSYDSVSTESHERGPSELLQKLEGMMGSVCLKWGDYSEDNDNVSFAMINWEVHCAQSYLICIHNYMYGLLQN